MTEGKHRAPEPPKSPLDYVCLTDSCRAPIGTWCRTSSGRRVDNFHQNRSSRFGKYQYDKRIEDEKREREKTKAWIMESVLLEVERIQLQQHEARLEEIRRYTSGRTD